MTGTFHEVDIRNLQPHHLTPEPQRSPVNPPPIPPEAMLQARTQTIRRKDMGFVQIVGLVILVSIIVSAKDKLRGLTVPCIQAIHATVKMPYELIGIDDGSRDDTHKYMLANCHKTIRRKTPSWSGFRVSEPDRLATSARRCSLGT